jgi:hypothetical protein
MIHSEGYQGREVYFAKNKQLAAAIASFEGVIVLDADETGPTKNEPSYTLQDRAIERRINTDESMEQLPTSKSKEFLKEIQIKKDTSR